MARSSASSPLEAPSRFERPVGAGLVLRAVRDQRDVERFAQLHTEHVSAVEGISCLHLLRYHPEIRFDHFLVVEEQDTGRLVATVCLIPWRISFCGCSLRVAMLEMVLSHPDYRHRGLARAQIQRFHELVQEEGFDLSIIEGIPYYYRQYGYGYSCDHWRRESLLAARVPDPPSGGIAHRLRPATLGDVPLLTARYAEVMSALDIYTTRSPEYWRFLLEREVYPVRMLEPAGGGAPEGYIVTLPAAPGAILVAESGITTHAAALAALHLLKAEGASEIQVGWPETSALVRLGRSLGSTHVPAYQWLIRFTDLPALLLKLAPVFEQRLAASDCAGLTVSLTLNVFRQAYALDFEAGRLQRVRPLGFVDSSMGADGGDLCIPPDALVRLVMGYRSLDELRDAWPDIVVKPASRRALEVLFPRLQSYMWMPYLYCGPIPPPEADESGARP